ncbi:extracellular solute-binding protein [Puniceicoccus vermicola]|uniref:Extracellular solute-binding protein n=1 Tax=Puniceicoccus vermicola TaxID=388746 RepID=A0A7X1E699_9BACT|nr:extracellular solute-binding protein [Puniceicoccus vermicola]MBC2603921.1 extracellular solute-binding protein [Puniceicoccus vermicola]
MIRKNLAFLSLPLAAIFANAAEVNIYTARHYPGDDELYEKFEEKTGIEVNVVDGKGDALLERIKAEGDNSPADVFITVDAGRLWAAEQAGIFAPAESEILIESVPAEFRDPDNLWFGITKRARLIFYSKERVDPADLSTYQALTDPEWEDSILIRSSSNVYNQSLLGMIIAEEGEEGAEEWAAGIVENFARKPQSNDTGQLRAVAAGLGDIAIANHYYYVRLMGSDKPEDQEVIEKVGVFFPNQGEGEGGAHVNISGAGMVKGAPHPEEAVQFLEFMVSPEAQEILANGNSEFPVNPDAEVPEVLESFVFVENDTPSSVIGDNNPEAIRIFDRVGWR